MLSPADVFAVISDQPGAIWLDGGQHSRSLICWAPEEVITAGNDWPAAGRSLTRNAGPSDHFEGGCVGYIGYGAGHRVAPVPEQAPTPEPEVWLGRYRGGLSWHPGEQRWQIGGDPATRSEAARVLASAEPLPPPKPGTSTPTRSVPESSYLSAIHQVLELLHAGDCYQINLSRAVHLAAIGNAFDAYRRLRAHNDAAYGACMHLDDDLWVLCNSPELLLRVRDQHITSTPIKGTRPRDPDHDQALLAELRDSPKERAELTMIVDLVRNDLHRVAVPGSVRTSPRRLISHATVHHASQRVEARLQPDRDAWQALAALFPPGSVTGAPKVRACQRIAELEPEPRGLYCGAIGVVTDGGHLTFNVAIRTAIWSGTQVRYHVGGGIVAHSQPQAEWRETIHKAAALAYALHPVPG